MKELLGIINEFTDELDELKPAIQRSVGKLKEFGPDLDSLIRVVFFGVLDMYADGVKMLVSKHSFSTDEAIQLIVGTKTALNEFNRNLEKKRK